jgi:hypothetical protein
MLGGYESNCREINALNFLDLTYHRRPLLPYLCVMAGRSEIDMAGDETESAQGILERSVLKLVRLHAEAVDELEADKAKMDAPVRVQRIDQLARTGRNLGAFVAMGRKLAADLDALKAAVSGPAKSGRAATKAVAATEEMEMDDDSGRTPERMAEIHADIGRRLELARRSREQKSLDRDRGLPADRALLRGVEADGAAPKPA